MGALFVEKDKIISKLKQDIADLEVNEINYKSRELFKEDFDEYCQYVNGRREDTYIIKDKSSYKKLPSKDVKLK